MNGYRQTETHFPQRQLARHVLGVLARDVEEAARHIDVTWVHVQGLSVRVRDEIGPGTDTGRRQGEHNRGATVVTALARPHVIVYIHTHTRAHGTHPVPAAESSLMKRFLGCVVGDGAWRWDRVESKQRGEGAIIIVVPIAMHSPDSIDRPTDPIRARDGGAHPVYVCIIGCRLPSRYPPHTPPAHRPSESIRSQQDPCPPFVPMALAFH